MYSIQKVSYCILVCNYFIFHWRLQLIVSVCDTCIKVQID